jgi:peptidoglycan/xylan/chitin deacetylase (PgdA/CDA1 family)
MREFAKKIIQRIDEAYLRGVLTILGDRQGMRGLLFHSVFSDSGEMECNHIHPQQGLSLEYYRRIFEYFLKHNYRFLRYVDLDDTLPPEGKYIYVTFDDGYYNNIKILKLIEELSIPIHLFVTTKNIVNNSKYWWDVIYYHRSAAGVDKETIARELIGLKKLPVKKIEQYILDGIGSEAFRPMSDLDRPLSPDELRDLSRHELVTIGNHTNNHAIIPTLGVEEIEREITGAHEVIKQVTGRDPVGFAFPNGNYRSQDIDLIESMGINLGFSCDPRNNRIPEDIISRRRLILGRYSVSGRTNLEWQGKIIRAGASPFLKAQQFRNRWK